MDKLRKLQLTELMMLKEFIRICETYGFRYYVCAGTCLGAVRHGGFIPWDNDIDVAMPREDYKKFLEIAPEVISRDYIVSSYDSSPADKLASVFYSCCMRMFNKNLILEARNVVPPRRTYSYMDIIPIDGLPDSKWLRAFHARLFLIKNMCYVFSNFRKIVNQRRIGRPWYKQLIVWFCNRVDVPRLFDPKKRFAAGNKVLEKYSFYKQRWCGHFGTPHGLKDIFPTDFFGEGVKLKFEDIEVTAPQNYDGYLKSRYGDYMALPSLERRNRRRYQYEIILNEEERQ
jgi:lipopolysaccharide cholinephosphotransferase